MYQGAGDFYYKVGYRKMPSEGEFTVNEIRDLNTTEYEVATTEINQAYEFYVQSHNEKGPGPEPKIITNSSGANSKNYFKVFSQLISILLARIPAQVSIRNSYYLPAC